MNEKLLVELEQAAAKLDNVSDALNKRIEEIEDRLTRAKIGVTFWHEIDTHRTSTVFASMPASFDLDGQAVEGVRGYMLGYARLETWRIAVRLVHIANGKLLHAEKPIALLSAPRAARYAAFEQMDEMLRGLTLRIKMYTKEIEGVLQKNGGDF